MKVVFCFLAVRLLCLCECSAQTGVLDTSFAQLGYAFPLSVPVYASGQSILQQPDGKVLVGGEGINSSFVLARFLPNGVADGSFGNGGYVEHSIEYSPSSSGYLALQPDGKILQSGACSDVSGKACYLLARYNADGSMDQSFNGVGYVLTSFNSIGANDYGYDCAVQSDGKIVQTGFAQSNAGVDFCGIVRYNPNGTLDNAFGTGGKAMYTVGNSQPQILSIKIQPDGKILAGGFSWSTPSQSPTCFSLLRLNADGTLDNTFNGDGKATIYFGAGGPTGASYDYDEAYALFLLPDGKIVQAGVSVLGTTAPGVLDYAVAFVRYSPAGVLDPSFGNGGKLRVPIDSIFSVKCGVLQPDGKFLLASNKMQQSGVTDCLVMRFNENGTPDNTFGSNGLITFSVNPSDTPTVGAESISGIALQQDGKILVSGATYNTGLFAARLLSGLELGVIDFASPQYPVLVYPNPITSEAALTYTLTRAQPITISLLDVQGRTVQTFIDHETQSVGQHRMILRFNNLVTGAYLLAIGNDICRQSIKVIF